MSDRHWWSSMISAVAGASTLLIHIPRVLQILFVLMLLDLILTRLVAKSWSLLMKRLAQMVGTSVLLAALQLSEQVLGFAAMEYTAAFFIVHELIAITEKAAELGVPIPERVRRMLVALREETDEQQNRAQNQSHTENSR
jgi:phage-related holin